MTESGATAEDRDMVLAAARLGWTLAEVRGRVRDVASGVADPPGRPKGVLPLGQERSQKEQLIEYFNVIASLAEKLDVDVPAKSLSHAPANIGADRASQWLKDAAWATAVASNAPGAASRAADAKDLATVYYSWDARIQDEFASQPSLSAAYQLGRAVGETRWSFDLAKSNPSDLPAGAFLLGPERGRRVDRLIERLAAHYDPVTRNALEHSLRAWRIADTTKADPPNEQWRMALAAQATIWHDLILGQRDGASLVSPRDLIEHPFSLIAIVRRLWPEFTLIVVGIVLLIVAAYWLTTPGATEQVAAIAGVLGITGVTAGSLAARARTQANDLFGALRRDIYRDLVADKATVRPGSIQPVARESNP